MVEQGAACCTPLLCTDPCRTHKHTCAASSMTFAPFVSLQLPRVCCSSRTLPLKISFCCRGTRPLKGSSWRLSSAMLVLGTRSVSWYSCGPSFTEIESVGGAVGGVGVAMLVV